MRTWADGVPGRREAAVARSEWNDNDSGCRRRWETNTDVTFAIGRVNTMSQQSPQTRDNNGPDVSFRRRYTNDEIETDEKDDTS